MKTVLINTRVELELLSDAEPPELLKVVVVEDRMADFAKGLLGLSTPLAKLILGQEVGDTLIYPQGDLYAVRILSIEEPEDFDPAEAARAKAEKDERLALDVAADNAAVFAASFSGKCGDYDPDGVRKWKEEHESRQKSEDKSSPSKQD